MKIIITSLNLSMLLAIPCLVAISPPLLFDQHVVSPHEHKEVAMDPSLLDRYTGKYQVEDNILEIFKKDQKLYRRIAGADDVQLKPESNTKFFYANNNDKQMEFEVDQNGKLIKGYFTFGGTKLEMKKVFIVKMVSKIWLS